MLVTFWLAESEKNNSAPGCSDTSGAAPQSIQPPPSARAPATPGAAGTESADNKLGQPALMHEETKDAKTSPRKILELPTKDQAADAAAAATAAPPIFPKIEKSAVMSSSRGETAASAAAVEPVAGETAAAPPVEADAGQTAATAAAAADPEKGATVAAAGGEGGEAPALIFQAAVLEAVAVAIAAEEEEAQCQSLPALGGDNANKELLAQNRLCSLVLPIILKSTRWREGETLDMILAAKVAEAEAAGEAAPGWAAVATETADQAAALAAVAAAARAASEDLSKQVAERDRAEKSAPQRVTEELNVQTREETTKTKVRAARVFFFLVYGSDRSH